MNKIRAYLRLTKPGIIRGNILTVIAGFFIGSGSNIEFTTLLFCILGSALIIASGCVFNNLIDKDIDKKMTRTKKRATVTQELKTVNIYIFGSILVLLGSLVLFFKTNTLTLIAGLIGFVFYVFVYAYFKRKNEHGTLVGSISGAIPPLAGYLAAKNEFDLGAVLVFVILVVWQMPHFYSIAIFRRSEYQNAGLPLLSITRGVKTTRQYILVYIVLFMIVCVLPTIFGITGLIFMSIMLLIGTYWLYVSISNYKLEDNAWAKKVFFSSLLVLVAFAFAAIFDNLFFK